MIAIENIELFSKLASEDNFANRKIPELGNLTTQQFLENLREKLKKPLKNTTLNKIKIKQTKNEKKL